MSFKTKIVRRLPLAVQDSVRAAAEHVDPRRRALLAARHAGHAEATALARKVSPTGRVLAGPFAGLLLDPETLTGSMAPLLAGTYEEELTPALEGLIARQPPLVVNVGSGEGYYAVGLAKRLPQATVHAFDIDPAAKPMAESNATRNNARNLLVHGRIDTAKLESVLIDGALVISDCEGFEKELLDPMAVPMLSRADMLVELHDFLDPTITVTIRERFEATHEISLVPFEQRHLENRPQLAHLTSDEVTAAMAEGRPIDPWPMQWAVLTSRVQSER